MNDPTRPLRTRRLEVVDEAGVPRIRLTASADDGGQITLLDPDGFERITISAAPDRGAVTLTARTDPDAHPTRVELFALDPEPPDLAYVGFELIDTGTTVAGFALYQSHPPHPWTAER
jgi:GAF domain-containing protein